MPQFRDDDDYRLTDEGRMEVERVLAAEGLTASQFIAKYKGGMLHGMPLEALLVAVCYYEHERKEP